MTATDPKPPCHPIFGVQEFTAPLGQIHRLVHRRRPHNQPGTNIIILKESVETTRLSFEHHENALFEKIFAVQPLRHLTPLAAWTHVMRESRRGPARAILVHQDDLHRLDQTPIRDDDRISCGRWSRVAKMSFGPQVWVTPWLPDGFERGEAVLGYRGDAEIDCGAFLTPLQNGRGCGHLFSDPDPNALGQPSDYFCRIVL